MSIELPSWLSWVATLAVGQHWPKGDEDGLRALGEAWDEAAQQLLAIGEEIGPATQGVLSNIGGQVADEFKSFVEQLQKNLPDMAQAAGNMGTLGKDTGLQVEYAKYMILAQLAWLAAEIVDLSWWAPEAVPAAITAARVAVWMILRRLLRSIATGIGFSVGMDALIQAIQFLKGDRTHWDWKSTLSAVESGAVSGAIGGILGEGAGHFAPKFAGSIVGKGVVGGLTGLTSAAALNGMFGNPDTFENLGEAGAGGAIGAMLSGGGRRGGGGEHIPKLDNPEIHVPGTPDFHLPGGSALEKPPVTIGGHSPADTAGSHAAAPSTTSATGLPRASGAGASGAGGVARGGSPGAAARGGTAHTAETGSAAAGGAASGGAAGGGRSDASAAGGLPHTGETATTGAAGSATAGPAHLSADGLPPTTTATATGFDGVGRSAGTAEPNTVGAAQPTGSAAPVAASPSHASPQPAAISGGDGTAVRPEASPTAPQAAPHDPGGLPGFETTLTPQQPTGQDAPAPAAATQPAATRADSAPTPSATAPRPTDTSPTATAPSARPTATTPTAAAPRPTAPPPTATAPSARPTTTQTETGPSPVGASRAQPTVSTTSDLPRGGQPAARTPSVVAGTDRPTVSTASQGPAPHAEQTRAAAPGVPHPQRNEPTASAQQAGGPVAQPHPQQTVDPVAHPQEATGPVMDAGPVNPRGTAAESTPVPAPPPDRSSDPTAVPGLPDPGPGRAAPTEPGAPFPQPALGATGSSDVAPPSSAERPTGLPTDPGAATPPPRPDAGAGTGPSRPTTETATGGGASQRPTTETATGGGTPQRPATETATGGGTSRPATQSEGGPTRTGTSGRSTPAAEPGRSATPPVTTHSEAPAPEPPGTERPPTESATHESPANEHPAPLPSATEPPATAHPPAAHPANGAAPADRPAAATATDAPAPSSHEPHPGLVEPSPDPVRPDQWQGRRGGAPAGHLSTERFDPQHGRPNGDGTLPGPRTQIRAWVRRIQADDGRWVRSISLSLPVRFGEGFHPDLLPSFQQRWNDALDSHFNTGFQLPKSGDQLHIDLSLTPVDDGRPAIELSMSPRPGRSDQLNFRLQQEDPSLGPDGLHAARQHNDMLGLHEFGHFAGLPDRYFDPAAIFRDSPGKSDSGGIMADVGHPPGSALPKRYLETIENVTDSGPVIRDHPLGAEPHPAPAAPPAPAEHTGSGTSAGPVHPASQAPPRTIGVTASTEHVNALGPAWKAYAKSRQEKNPELTFDHPGVTAAEVVTRIAQAAQLPPERFTVVPEDHGTVLAPGQNHSFTFRGPENRSVKVTVKLSGPEQPGEGSAAAGHGSSSAAGAPGPGREQKFAIAGTFSSAIEKELGFPVMLSGGGAVAYRFDSPRPVNDLDFRAPTGMTGLPDRIPAINEAVRKAFPDSTISDFRQDKHDPRAVSGKIDGVDVTIGPIAQTHYHDQVTEGSVHFPSDLDSIADKAYSFTQRSDEKQQKDLFDLLWAVKNHPASADQVVNELVTRRGGLVPPGGKPLDQLFADKLHEAMNNPATQNAWKRFGATKQDRDQLKSIAGQLAVSLPDHTHEPAMIVTAGNFTGDMFGVSGALLVNPELHVTVVSGNSHRDQVSDFLKQTLVSAGQSPDRVHTLDTGDAPPHRVMKEATHNNPALRTPLATHDVHPPIPGHLSGGDRQLPVSEATRQVGRGLTDARGGIRRDAIRNAWGVGEQHDSAAHDFLSSQGIPTQGHHVVLWSRFSGKKGGPHPQHDTSFTGLRQIIDRLPQETTVIIAGDKHPGSGDTKFTELVNQYPNVRDLTEFWKTPAWQAHFPGGDRADQFRLFDSLTRNGSTVSHLGFRSGNLEVYAVLGHPVRYLEEAGNGQGNRMLAWNDLGYKRVVVESPATLTGKWVVNQTPTGQAEASPPWLTKSAGPGFKDPQLKTAALDAAQLNDRRPDNRGFSETDLKHIVGFLDPGGRTGGGSRPIDPVSSLDDASAHSAAPAPTAPRPTETHPTAPSPTHPETAGPTEPHPATESTTTPRPATDSTSEVHPTTDSTTESHPPAQNTTTPRAATESPTEPRPATESTTTPRPATENTTPSRPGTGNAPVRPTTDSRPATEGGPDPATPGTTAPAHPGAQPTDARGPQAESQERPPAAEQQTGPHGAPASEPPARPVDQRTTRNPQPRDVPRQSPDASAAPPPPAHQPAHADPRPAGTDHRPGRHTAQQGQHSEAAVTRPGTAHHGTPPDGPDAAAPLPMPATEATGSGGEPERPAPTTPADPRHQRSLAGLKITDAPPPDDVRARIDTLLGGHHTEQQVRQRLDVQLDPANFRAQHPTMVNGGWRFPITVDGRPHEVRIDAAPGPWQPAAGTRKDSADVEATSSPGYAPEPRKVDATSSETGLDLAPSGFVPVNPHLNALVGGSLSLGGVSHGANTTVKSSVEASSKVTLTGTADNHTSRFTYDVRIVDDKGQPLPPPDSARTPITGEVKADIPRTDPAIGNPRPWNGWDVAPGDHPQGRPLTVTGLGGIRDTLFEQLPAEARPDGLAHQAILDFLDPKNVVDGFEHAAGWGLDSPQMTFSDGRTGRLRLTLHPQESALVDTVEHKSSLGSKSTTEHSGSRGNSSSRAIGASGGASGEVWASRIPGDKETQWLTGTAGYSYSASTAHQAKESSSVTAQSSREQPGKANVVATRVHFQVEVIKDHFSPGPDGTQGTSSRTIGLRDPLPEPAPGPDHIAITMEHPVEGEVVRLVPHRQDPPATGHPAADRQGTGPTSTSRHDTGRHDTGRPGTSRPATGQPSAEQRTDHPADGAHDRTPQPDPGSAPAHGGPTHDQAEPRPPQDATRPQPGDRAPSHPARSGGQARPREQAQPQDPAQPHTQPQPHGQVASPRTEPGPGARPQPPTAAELRGPGTAQRTTFLDVPGSAALERHIVTELHAQAPGLLPPPPDPTRAPQRVTPQAVENLRILHQQLLPSALRANAGKLLDGAFTITLDGSHLPGLPGRTYEIRVQAQLDHARATHLGGDSSTSKSSLALKTGAEKQIGSGGKHTVSLSGNLRSSLNPPDTTRSFLNAGADGSYSATHQVTTSSETEVKREFTLESAAQSFGYPVTYQVGVGRAGGTHQPSPVRPPDGQHLVAEVRPPVTSADPPRTLPLTELPSAHLVGDVSGADVFRQHAQESLDSAFRAAGGHTPDVSKALDSLTGQDQLRGQVSASHNAWSNTGTEHVGGGRNPDAVGLSVRTGLSNFRYRETLPGEGTLSVETKTGSSTTVTDKWSGGLKGGLGPDFMKYPENPVGLHESTYQVRGGFKGKGSIGRDGNDSVKSQVATSHKTTTPKGTWHVYQADAQVTAVGRVVDANGRTTYGEPRQSDHTVTVLLSDEDVRRLTAGPQPQDGAHPAATHPQPPGATDPATAHPQPTGTTGAAPGPRREAPLLDQGLPTGTVVEFHSTDGILKEIDDQLRGPGAPGTDRVPEAALPFAHTFSPHNLSANYPDLVGKGIFDYHVQETSTGRTVTEVVVRGVPQDPHWRDEGQQSQTDTSRTLTTSRTVKGNSGAGWTLGADGNFSASVRTPRDQPHLTNAGWGPSGGAEGGRTSGAESGVTVKTEQKTGKLGPGHRFSNGMRFEVTVSRRTGYGRFVNLPKEPGTVDHPDRITAWVPDSMTRPVTAPPADPPHGPQHAAGTGEPSGAARPTGPVTQPAPAANPAHGQGQGSGAADGIELQQIVVHRDGDPATDPAVWQQQLASAHDVVGFDRPGALLDSATTALNTPRPWSDTFLGKAGRTTSAALSTGAGWLSGAATKAAHAVLPTSVTDMADRVVNSFISDPRLDGHSGGADVQTEQRLPLDQRLGVRQVFSAHSLASVLGQARNPRAPYRTVPLGQDGRTGLQVSVTPTGPAEEVSVRPDGEDEISVATEDASGTSATSTYNWSVSPANFSVVSNKPLAVVPVNAPVKLTGEGSSERTAPVTRVPGQPSRTLSPAALPAHATPKEPGKAELKGPQALMRQPVRVTVQKADPHGTYGAPVPTDGHLYYWSAKPTAETPAPADQQPARHAADRQPPHDPAQQRPTTGRPQPPADQQPAHDLGGQQTPAHQNSTTGRPQPPADQQAPAPQEQLTAARPSSPAGQQAPAQQRPTAGRPQPPAGQQAPAQQQSTAGRPQATTAQDPPTGTQSPAIDQPRPRTPQGVAAGHRPQPIRQEQPSERQQPMTGRPHPPTDEPQPIGQGNLAEQPQADAGRVHPPAGLRQSAQQHLTAALPSQEQPARQPQSGTGQGQPRTEQRELTSPSTAASDHVSVTEPELPPISADPVTATAGPARPDLPSEPTPQAPKQHPSPDATGGTRPDRPSPAAPPVADTPSSPPAGQPRPATPEPLPPAPAPVPVAARPGAEPGHPGEAAPTLTARTEEPAPPGPVGAPVTTESAAAVTPMEARRPAAVTPVEGRRPAPSQSLPQSAEPTRSTAPTEPRQPGPPAESPTPSKTPTQAPKPAEPGATRPMEPAEPGAPTPPVGSVGLGAPTQRVEPAEANPASPRADSAGPEAPTRPVSPGASERAHGGGPVPLSEEPVEREAQAQAYTQAQSTAPTAPLPPADPGVSQRHLPSSPGPASSRSAPAVRPPAAETPRSAVPAPGAPERAAERGPAPTAETASATPPAPDPARIDTPRPGNDPAPRTARPRPADIATAPRRIPASSSAPHSPVEHDAASPRPVPHSAPASPSAWAPPPRDHVVSFADGHTADLSPDQRAAVGATAAELAALRALGGPPPTVTVNTFAAVRQNGVPHFGRSLSLATQRARAVADALRDALAGAGADVPITLVPHVNTHPEEVGTDQAVLVVTPPPSPSHTTPPMSPTDLPAAPPPSPTAPSPSRS